MMYAKYIALGVLVLAVIWAVVAYGNSREKVGYNRAINEVAAQDAKAVDHANQARNTVRDCRRTGRVFNVETGECI